MALDVDLHLLNYFVEGVHSMQSWNQYLVLHMRMLLNYVNKPQRSCNRYLLVFWLYVTVLLYLLESAFQMNSVPYVPSHRIDLVFPFSQINFLCTSVQGCMNVGGLLFLWSCLLPTACWKWSEHGWNMWNSLAVLTLLYCKRFPYYTAIDLQVRSDVTRYRYGDEQHLEEALKRIFKYGQVLNQVF